MSDSPFCNLTTLSIPASCALVQALAPSIFASIPFNQTTCSYMLDCFSDKCDH